MRGVRLGALGGVLVSFLVLAAAAAPAGGQGAVRVDGTVMWISGHTLALRSDIPSAPGYQICGRRCPCRPAPDRHL
jgi:hypothetical protein